jgi:hypothetical protein
LAAAGIPSRPEISRTAATLSAYSSAPWTSVGAKPGEPTATATEGWRPADFRSRQFTVSILVEFRQRGDRIGNLLAGQLAVAVDVQRRHQMESGRAAETGRRSRLSEPTLVERELPSFRRILAALV